MPPWHAEAPVGTFHNDRRLTDAEKETIARWVAGGSPQGDPKDLPPAPSFAEGWAIGQPDAVLTMQKEFEVPACRHHRVPELRRPDQFHRGQVGAGDGDAPERAERRAPHPGVRA